MANPNLGLPKRSAPRGCRWGGLTVLLVLFACAIVSILGYLL
mgnify:CR=1 FL=1